MSTHLHTITNEEFISVVFCDAPQDAVPWVTGFKEDPISVDGKHWAGAPVTNCVLPGMIDKESNNFMAISTFYRKEEVQRGQRVMRYRRRKENFAACHLIMIDDIGTKMQPLQIPLEPSYRLETSPGNYQYGYLLAAPGLDGDLVARVIDAMVAQGLTADGKDPGMKGVTRYGRLPVGWNTKAKYVERLGAPFVHQLEEWHPDRRFTLQEIIEAFELDLDRVKGKASAQTDDPILKALESRGLLKGQISGKEGVWDITCPWLDEHTDRADSGAAYFQPGYGGRLAPGFKCHHGHCESRTVKDLLRLLKPDTAPSIEGEPGKDTKKGKKDSVATKLVRIAERAIFKLWHDAEMNPWATLQINGHQEHYPLRNKAVRRHLAGLYFHSEGQAAHSQGIQDALAVLEAKATFEGEQHAVYVRVASHDGKVYLDLANAKWQAVEIDAQEWRVVDKPPVRFWRPRGMLPLPDPKPEGSLANLKALLNVDDRGTMFATAWLIGALKPRGPYPILNIEGESGTGKSTLCRKLRRLIDPHVALLRSPPREERDILIAGRNALVVGFDNLSGLPVWLSDALCRVSTGGGMSTRELYTDQDEVFFDVMRPIIVNGIDSIGTCSDYRDRSMWMLLHSLTDIHEEQDIWEGFEEQHPFILGALLYAVSAALRHWDTTKLSAKPRMADFARWIAAAEAGGALPWGAGEFITAYLKFRDNQAREALSGDKVAEGLFLFMKQFQKWTGTLQALKKGVEFVAGAGKLGDTWPKTPKGLGGVLRRIAPDLRRAKIIDVSFDITREQKTGKTQVILTALENMCKTTSPSSPDDKKHPENGSTQRVEAGEDSSVQTSPKLHPNFTPGSRATSRG